MAPCRSPPRPRSTSGSPEPRGRTWRTCSGPRVHRDCSADEPIPDPPPAPAAPHCGIASPGTGDAPRPLAARLAPVRVSRGGRPAGSRRVARCLSDVGGRARAGCGAGAAPRARRHHSLWPARRQGRDRVGGVRRAGDRAASGAGGEARHAGPARDRGRHEQGIVQQAARAVKRATPDLLVIGDACLCEYTDHGHCGVVQDGDVDNDASVYLLGKVAVTQARAGIDIVAPSDMMDGRVAGIRKALDAAGFSRLPIMSYAAKMASAFYGPFREAAGSTPQFGDRQSYQMQGTNADEAMREIRLDVEEGADIVLVKPALPCLDLISRAKQEFGSPLAAYQVSGEYAMIKAAAQRNMLDECRAMWETLHAIRRAGADIILSYFAQAAAELL